MAAVSSNRHYQPDPGYAETHSDTESLHQRIAALEAEVASRQAIIERMATGINELAAERDALRAQLAEAQAEIAVDDSLLAERNRVLEAIPECPVHGSQCIPHALKWIAEQRATQTGQYQPVGAAEPNIVCRHGVMLSVHGNLLAIRDPDGTWHAAEPPEGYVLCRRVVAPPEATHAE